MIIQVCNGSACHLKGSYNVIQKLKELIKLHQLHEKVEFTMWCLSTRQLVILYDMIE